MQIFKGLVYSKIQVLFEKELTSDFSPSGPAPHVMARFSPQALFGPSSLGVFAKRRTSIDFVHYGNDAFTLSHHCHVGPTHQLRALPHASQSHSRRRFFSSPPATLRCPASIIEMPI
jgi:hypothetical protein